MERLILSLCFVFLLLNFVSAEYPEPGKCLFSLSIDAKCEEDYSNSIWTAENIEWSLGNEGWENSPNPDDSHYVLFDNLIEPGNPGFDNKWHYDPIINGKNYIFTTCRSTTQLILCSRKVPFFGIYNLVISSSLIVLIYLVLFLKKRSRGVKTE